MRPVTVTVVSHETSVDVEGPPGVVQAVILALPPGAAIDIHHDVRSNACVRVAMSDDRRSGTVSSEHTGVMTADGWGTLVRLAVSATFESLAATAPGHVFVRGVSLGWRGVGIVIPGPLGCGGADLLRRSTEAGAEYYSGDYAVLDGHGLLHPFASSLGSGDVERQGSGSNPPMVGRRPLNVGIVVAGPLAGGPTTASGNDAAASLLRHRVPATSVSVDPIVVTARAVRCALAVPDRLTDAAQFSSELLDLADHLAGRAA